MPQLFTDILLQHFRNMYIHMEDVAFAVYYYFTERSKKDVEFAVQVRYNIVHVFRVMGMLLIRTALSGENF